ncbi:MAG: PLDc N-terminal domain-containing protein [Pirellulaceae bacterium]
MTIVLIVAVVMLITTVLFLNLVHPFICIVSCARSPETSGMAKLLWILATLALWSTGSVLYGLFGTHSPRLRSLTIKSFALCLLSLATVAGFVIKNPEFREQFVEAIREREQLMNANLAGEDFNFDQEFNLENADFQAPEGLEDGSFAFDQIVDQLRGDDSNADNATKSIVERMQQLRDQISKVKLGENSGEQQGGSQESGKQPASNDFPTLPGESKVRMNPYAQQGT